VSATTRAALEQVADALRADGGLLAAALLPAGPQVPADDPHAGRLAADGPRASADPAAYAAVVEAAREGHLLHHGRSRLLDGADRDLALLAGDRLYALGLAWLAELGDVDAVRELADVIGLCAQAQAAGDDALAEPIWVAGACAIGWGTSAELEAAKGAVRRQEAAAGERLMGAARQIAGDLAPAR
jgi:hypothetical protein